jgi:hypothetical protein
LNNSHKVKIENKRPLTNGKREKHISFRLKHFSSFGIDVFVGIFWVEMLSAPTMGTLAGIKM